ncbi:hypothetical protein PML78_12480 [Enterococcus dispar]|uniref:hypothetical protein n=1 Tax=Enterococcus dispar TaxID=44009 RepID=UPI00232CFE1C|nr:hypothetical protein [Enterococcus dispar]WCG32990.1 hypothetical protein PML78_12480 [Enterococcus dispar]
MKRKCLVVGTSMDEAKLFAKKMLISSDYYELEYASPRTFKKENLDSPRIEILITPNLFSKGDDCFLQKIRNEHKSVREMYMLNYLN